MDSDGFQRNSQNSGRFWQNPSEFLDSSGICGGIKSIGYASNVEPRVWKGIVGSLALMEADGPSGKCPIYLWHLCLTERCLWYLCLWENRLSMSLALVRYLRLWGLIFDIFHKVDAIRNQHPYVINYVSAKSGKIFDSREKKFFWGGV